MLNSQITLSDLFILLNSKFGKKAWYDFEPETILLEFKESVDNVFLLAEKIYALQALVNGLPIVLGIPEFILWLTSICNNEPASFESIASPTSPEFAWMLKQIFWLSPLLNEPFPATDAMRAVIRYFLIEDGYSETIEPFNLLGDLNLPKGQTENDTEDKKRAITWYIAKMKEESK